MSDRQYKDVSGNPCNLLWLVKNEPEWAENQIRHRDKLERELAAAKERIKSLEEAGKNLTKAEGEDELLRAIREFDSLL
jgi:hypothetical protein